MTSLSSFSEEEQQLIVSLPYKVGMWVSYADDVDGEEDDALEERALRSCIKAVARLHDDKPFIKAVAVETLRRQDEWGVWAEQAFYALKEVEAVVAVLKTHLPADQVKNYKGMLIEVASVVAQASGEFDVFDDVQDEGGFGAFIGKIVAGFSGHDDHDHPMNVSASEDSAINQLRAALSPAK